MKLTAENLRRIVLEEMNNVKMEKRQSLQESKSVKITPEYLNRLIKEEYSAIQNQPVKVTPEYLNRLIKEEYSRFNRRK